MALWFWAPLVAGWLTGSQQEEVEAAVAPATVMASNHATAAERAEAAPRREAPLRWSSLNAARQRDPRIQPAPAEARFADPFHRAGEEPPPLMAETPVAELIAEATPPVVRSPAELGLHLTGVLMGASARVAMINGRKFREQEVIALASDGAWLTPDPGQTPAWEFRIVQIAARYVLVATDNDTYKIEMRRPYAMTGG